jgi:hypothetical protein
MSKFIATVKNVKEVALVASANLAFWREKLATGHLFPYNRNGKAELLMSANSFLYQGKKTNEFIVSLTVSKHPDGASMDGAFLLQAFNSSRLFAWIERTFFQTPYNSAAIRLENSIPAFFILSHKREQLIEANMVEIVQRSGKEDQLWEGPIFLPQPGDLHSKSLNFYNARLGGPTDIYPYNPDQNAFNLHFHPSYPFIQWLTDSDCKPLEWRIRNNAAHARSQTYQWKGD